MYSFSCKILILDKFTCSISSENDRKIICADIGIVSVDKVTQTSSKPVGNLKTMKRFKSVWVYIQMICNFMKYRNYLHEILSNASN